MKFTKHGSIYLLKPTYVSKVLNLVFNFFCRDFLGKSKKEFVMFISKQVEKYVLVKCMHYPKKEKHIIYFYYVARLESDLLNQCVYYTL